MRAIPTLEVGYGIVTGTDNIDIAREALARELAIQDPHGAFWDPAHESALSAWREALKNARKVYVERGRWVPTNKAEREATGHYVNWWPGEGRGSTIAVIFSE